MAPKQRDKAQTGDTTITLKHHHNCLPTLENGMQAFSSNSGNLGSSLGE
ncbi:hypothetical protein ASB1_11210 [Helicobacter heilmannii]|nr:hypothetical protein ASB1_11210 [Helicobacter heilmannii]